MQSMIPESLRLLVLGLNRAAPFLVDWILGRGQMKRKP